MSNDESRLPRLPDATPAALSRREIMAASAALASLALGGAPVSAAAGVRAGKGPRAPFDSIRDWVAALDAHGLLLRVPRIDQDAYEATGLFYRATDRHGMYGAPAMIFDNVKSGGEWRGGPVLANMQGNWHTDAIIWGLDIEPGNGPASYRKAKAYLSEMLAGNGGSYPAIAPREVSRDQAPCKQVVLRGDDIDLTKFAFMQTNPTDGGRYVNTGSVFMDDAEMGGNFGTYRCQIKGPRLIGVNPEPNQTGWKMLMAAKKRGDALAKVSIVVGQDPYVWLLSGTRVAPRMGKPVDELAIAGGMRGKAIDVVRSETNDMRVPAHAEMVIEGEVPLQEQMLPEGPFGEMFGYMGPRKDENFWMNVTAVTHRRDPWLMNAFTGMQRGMVIAPMDALYETLLRRAVPNLVEIFQPQDAMGVALLSIDKNGPGQGMKAGRIIAERNPIAKVVIVVDKDIDILNRNQVVFALGSRWQPDPASMILKDVVGIITDPSQVVQGRTSKIVIDATRQLPDEGGRAAFPETNRALLVAGSPDVFARTDEKFARLLERWKPV
jgi:4-hydroxy-3-polyprenylbenzoate decarboxylase